MASRHNQRGFTLIELMIAVAIVGVLAATAVYLFRQQQTRVEATTEVTAVFSELVIRQEQYRTEGGNYLSTGASESDLYPAGSPSTTTATIVFPSPPTGDFATLRFLPDIQSARCGYVAIAGEAGDTAAVGTIAGDATLFNYTPPMTDWYYLLAKCDMNQDASDFSYYFRHSEDSKMYWVNQGK